MIWVWSSEVPSSFTNHGQVLHYFFFGDLCNVVVLQCDLWLDKCVDMEKIGAATLFSSLTDLETWLFKVTKKTLLLLYLSASYFCDLIITFLIEKWYLLMVLTYIYLMTNVVGHICAYKPFVYILCISIYFNPIDYLFTYLFIDLCTQWCWALLLVL